MVVILPKGSVRNKKLYGITHFLRIPFATPKSTPQLLQSLGQVSQDPIAAALPRAAWNTLDELPYLVGALSLLKPGRLDRAIQLLRELNMDSIARAIATTSGTDVVKQPTCRSTETVHPVQAPIISLQGLGLTPAHDHLLRKAKEMICDIRESRPFLEQFKLIVSKIFQDADLIRVAGPAARTLSLKLMNTRYLRTQVPNEKPTLKGKKPSWNHLLMRQISFPSTETSLGQPTSL